MVVAPPSSATAATAAALLAGGAVLLALKWRRSGEGPPDGFPNRVELLEGETSAIMMGGAPSVSAGDVSAPEIRNLRRTGLGGGWPRSSGPTPG